MEFKKGDLRLFEEKTESSVFKKVLSKFMEIKNKAKLEIEETKALVRIIVYAVKSYSKNREFDLDKKDMKFIQGQSADVIKNLLMVTISLIPIPIPVVSFLIIFGKKLEGRYESVFKNSKEHTLNEVHTKKYLNNNYLNFLKYYTRLPNITIYKNNTNKLDIIYPEKKLQITNDINDIIFDYVIDYKDIKNRFSLLLEYFKKEEIIYNTNLESVADKCYTTKYLQTKEDFLKNNNTQ